MSRIADPVAAAANSRSDRTEQHPQRIARIPRGAGVPWMWLELVGEPARPACSFSSYRSQRNFLGWYRPATAPALAGQSQ